MNSKRPEEPADGEAFPRCGLAPLHPGELLREETLPNLGLSKVQAARDMGVGRATLYNLLDGKAALTPGMALRIAKLSGTKAEFWMNLQVRYDLRMLREALAEDLAAIPTHKPKAA